MLGRGWRTRAAIALSATALTAGCDGPGENEPERATRPDPPAADREGADGGGGPPPVGDGRGGVALSKLGDFEQPLHLAQPSSGDDDHLYVVEQCGRIRRVPLDGGPGTVFLDLTDRVTCGGEQGLLSVAFAPDHARSGLLYVYFTDTAGDQRVVEYRRSREDPASADPGSARELLRMDDFASNHNGGLLLFGPDDLLYIGTGDGGGAGDPQRTAQDLDSLLGKLLRIDPARGRPYGVPAANPHAGEPGARGEVVAHGLRNPWRYSFDRKTGDLWIGDVGQDELEEIDSAPASAIGGPGLDFGWSAFEGSERFNDDQRAPGAREPTLVYGRERGCSVTGGHVVRDPELRSLYGRYLYGDFCAGELRSLVAGPGEPASDDVALGPEVAALASFAEDAAGRLYAISLDGPVFRLVGRGES